MSSVTASVVRAMVSNGPTELCFASTTQSLLMEDVQTALSDASRVRDKTSATRLFLLCSLCSLEEVGHTRAPIS
jgi:hypothetical protein